MTSVSSPPLAPAARCSQYTHTLPCPSPFPRIPPLLQTQPWSVQGGASTHPASLPLPHRHAAAITIKTLAPPLALWLLTARPLPIYSSAAIQAAQPSRALGGRCHGPSGIQAPPEEAPAAAQKRLHVAQGLNRVRVPRASYCDHLCPGPGASHTKAGTPPTSSSSVNNGRCCWPPTPRPLSRHLAPLAVGRTSSGSRIPTVRSIRGVHGGMRLRRPPSGRCVCASATTGGGWRWCPGTLPPPVLAHARCACLHAGCALMPSPVALPRGSAWQSMCMLPTPLSAQLGTPAVQLGRGLAGAGMGL